MSGVPRKWAICPDCNQPMEPGAGCDMTHFKLANGEIVARVPHDDPHDDEGDCHDCNVLPGQYHHFGCDWESCPICGRQAAGCECLNGAKPICGGGDIGEGDHDT